MEGNAKVIAVTGKGGVGKTSLAAALVRSLTEKYKEAKILAIDADPAVGLATALDVEVKETLDDIRLEITEGVSEKLKETQDILSEARFRLLDMMDEKDGLHLLQSGGRSLRDVIVQSILICVMSFPCWPGSLIMW